MQRPLSSMTAEELQHWRERTAHSLTTGAEALGISRNTFARLLRPGSKIPKTVALLVRALDRLGVTHLY